MTNSTYHVIELIGSSSDSWELAAQNAVREAAKVYEDLRVAEVVEMEQVDACQALEELRVGLLADLCVIGLADPAEEFRE